MENWSEVGDWLEVDGDDGEATGFLSIEVSTGAPVDLPAANVSIAAGDVSRLFGKEAKRTFFPPLRIPRSEPVRELKPSGGEGEKARRVGERMGGDRARSGPGDKTADPGDEAYAGEDASSTDRGESSMGEDESRTGNPDSSGGNDGRGPAGGMHIVGGCKASDSNSRRKSERDSVRCSEADSVRRWESNSVSRPEG